MFPPRTFGASLFLLALGCGSSAEPESPLTRASAGGEHAEPTEEDPLAVTGLRGTLSQSEIQNALEPRMMKLSRCVERRSSQVEWISGELELTFHVALDGSVTSVYPSKSTFGDREAERCMVDVARSTRFPEPHGGEADFSWSLDVPLDSDVRAPVEWGPADAADVLAEHGPEALAACGGSSYAITAYVDPDGRVVAAGAATQSEQDASNLDCITQQVASWTLPSPGSYAAKLALELR
jgi:hypothetical protein